MTDALLRNGLAIRGDVIGKGRSEAALAGGTDFDRPFQEVFLQATIYCGVSTAGGAFKMAREVFEEADFAGLGGTPD